MIGIGTAMAEDWDKTFPKSDKVDVQKIEFTNRYGITLVGDLYIPKNAALSLLHLIRHLPEKAKEPREM